MTVLLEFKQKLKNLYGKYESYFQPLLKFFVALVYFTWINQHMGYMAELDNIFILLILSLVSCIFPSAVMIFAGFVLMVGHCYALGPEVAAFMLVLILFMLIMFLRFSAGSNIVVAFAPLSFGLHIPVLLPIGTGLLCPVQAVLPAGCGVIIYHFVRLLEQQAQVLQSSDTEVLDKLTLMADGIVQNWEMWVTVITCIVVTVLVNLIRTRSFDYAWRIAIVFGGLVYVMMMLGGSYYFNVEVDMPPLILSAVVSVLIGLILEFFVFGGDYSRIERLEYQDDEYFYYVKAVPKASVSTSERSIKKISGGPVREERRMEESVVSYSSPVFQGVEGQRTRRKYDPDGHEDPVMPITDLDDVDFEKKLEESLRDL